MFKSTAMGTVASLLVVMVILAAVCGIYFAFTVFSTQPEHGDQSPGGQQTERWVYGGLSLQTDELMAAMPEVIRFDSNEFMMFYGAAWVEGSSIKTSIKRAVSSDGVNFTYDAIVLEGAAEDNDPEATISGPSVVKLPDGRYRMYYVASPQPRGGTSAPKYHIRSAISEDGINFVKENGTRINIKYFDPNSNLRLAGHGTYFIASDGTYVGIFSGEFVNDSSDPSDLKIAFSSDGLIWENFATLYGDWHDPIVLRVGNGYKLYATYLLEKQGTAFSSDGKTWPSQMTEIRLENQAGQIMSENNSGVGDIGGVVLGNGNIRLFTNFGSASSSTAIAYFERVG